MARSLSAHERIRGWREKDYMKGKPPTAFQQSALDELEKGTAVFEMRGYTMTSESPGMYSSYQALVKKGLATMRVNDEGKVEFRRKR